MQRRREAAAAAISAILILLASAVTTYAQAPPVPVRLKAITEQLYAAHTDLANGTDEQRRALTKMVVEQTVFEFPKDGWGWKSASPTRPPSKDCIARRGANYFVCYDWQSGTTRKPRWPFLLNDITGQTWIDVAGRNHLGADSPDLPPPPDPPPATDPALAALAARVATLEKSVAAQGIKLAQVESDLAALTGRLEKALERITALEQAQPICTEEKVRTESRTVLWSSHSHDVAIVVCRPPQR